MCRERRQVGRRKLESWMNVEVLFLWSSVDKNMSPDSAFDVPSKVQITTIYRNWGW
jgi:hypothetical protein